jgi:hypothetical protein
MVIFELSVTTGARVVGYLGPGEEGGTQTEIGRGREEKRGRSGFVIIQDFTGAGPFNGFIKLGTQVRSKLTGPLLGPEAYIAVILIKGVITWGTGVKLIKPL